MKSVHTAGDEVEALMLQGLLEQAGIPVVLRSRRVPGYGGAVEKATGTWGDLLVPDDREAEARSLLADYLAGRDARGGGGRRVAGVVVPIVTLFDERGRLDEEANARHVEWLIGRGVDGLFALGTSGEFTSLSREERRAFADLVVRTARGRVPVLVGVSSPWTDEAVGYAEHAHEIGANGVVAVLPYYWIPSDRSIYEHFRLLAVGADLPVYIYNFPALTGRSIPPRLVLRLAEEHPKIAGIKDTVDSIAHLQQVLALVKPVRPEFTVLCGMDYHLLNTLLLGGDGVVPGTGNFFPDPLVHICRAVEGDRLEEAARTARTLAAIPSLFDVDAAPFVVIKEAMVQCGLLAHATARPPAVALTEEERARLRRGLEALGAVPSGRLGSRRGPGGARR